MSPRRGDATVEHRRARLLASGLVVLMALGATSATVQLLIVDDFVTTFAVIMAVVGVLGVALVFLRRGRFLPAAVLASVLPSVASIAAAAANPDDTIALAFASLGAAIASMFLSTRAAALLGGAVVVAIAALPLARPELPVATIAGAACFNTIMTALVIVGARHRDQAEGERLREQARLHEQLLRSDRLASLGMLAAGVAHEIGNPLMCASANLELLDRRLATPDDRALLVDARHGVDRIGAIARGLTSFARGSTTIAAPADVQRALESAIAMASAEIRPRARLVRDYAAAPTVHADAIGLEQVFLNLLINAAHAIPEGDPDEHEIRVGLQVVADRVEISVRDTGRGIPDDQLDRIFEPFVSTKPAGQGTGLGLTVCREIVASLGGTIGVSSHVGRGTTFRVELPTAR